MVFVSLFRIFSLKSDFLPYIIKKQFSSLKKHLNKANASGTSQKFTPKLLDYVKIDELTQLINKASISKSANEHLGCFGFLQADGFCFRANNLTIFAEANRQVQVLNEN